MSYSFSLTANNKTDATGKIREQFDRVVEQQPSHHADKEGAIVAAQTLVRLLAEPDETNEIYVNVTGSLGWKQDSPEEFISAYLSIVCRLQYNGK